MAKQHQELIAREGWVFLAIPLGLALLSLLLGWSIWVTLTAVVLALYVAYFFRNPYRQIPVEPGLVVSPADGKVVTIRTCEDGREMISIFLNIFNVHVNRSPMAGEVKRVQYTPGKFVNAYRADASEINERNALSIDNGQCAIEVVQIAGLIARRIVCWAKESDQLTRGERIGLIRFGSRVDLFLPAQTEICVELGQKVAGGSDILARLPES